MTPTNSPESAVLTEREQFEKWAQSEDYDLRPMSDLREDFSDSYVSPSTTNAWSSWQARAALSTSHEASGEAVRPDREDARRYCHPGFQKWLDEEVSDGGRTVFDLLHSVHDAYSGFCASPNYPDAPPSAQPATTPSAEPRLLPETMSRDEMLQHYSSYANLCAHEALQYQKRIRELEEQLAATKQPAGEVQEAVPVYFEAREIGEGDWFRVGIEETERIASIISSPTMDYRVLYDGPPPAALAVPDGWQPIETAPKDGTNVLLVNRKGNMAAGLWMDSLSGSGWYLRGGSMKPDVFFNNHHGPTHWMPLPDAPQQPKEP